MKDYNDAYKEAYDTIISDIRGKLQDIKDYDIRQQYEKLVEDIAEQIAVSYTQSLICLDFPGLQKCGCYKTSSEYV